MPLDFNISLDKSEMPLPLKRFVKIVSDY